MTKRQTKRKKAPVKPLMVDEAIAQAWKAGLAGGFDIRDMITGPKILPFVGFVQRGELRWPVNVDDLKAYRKEGFVAIGREGSKMVAHLTEYEF